MKTFIFYFSLSVLLIVTIPALVSAECTCDPEDEGSDKAGALKYKIAAIPCILLAGALGVLFPVLGNVFPALQPETNLFFAIKAFAAGVILSTGFIHVLPDAFEMLTSPCLKNDVWEKFPFTGFIAMVAAMGTLSVDAFATSYFKKAHLAREEDAADTEAQPKTQLLRHRVVAQVLEVGIIVHSVIIGITLGASQNPEAIKPLFAALMFHQCFEGMGLGGCITQAKFNWTAVTIMTLFFSITTPIGIGVGMGISNSYSESSPTALIVQGVLSAASAGILIYMALVDFLAADFMHPKMQASYGLQVLAHVALLLGAALMSVLAKWA